MPTKLNSVPQKWAIVGEEQIYRTEVTVRKIIIFPQSYMLESHRGEREIYTWTPERTVHNTSPIPHKVSPLPPTPQKTSQMCLSAERDKDVVIIHKFYALISEIILCTFQYNWKRPSLSPSFSRSCHLSETRRRSVPPSPPPPPGPRFIWLENDPPRV